MSTRAQRERRELLIGTVIALLAGAFFLASAVFLVLFITDYRNLDREVSGSVTEQKTTRDGCTSTVSYTVDDADYETVYGTCPGVGNSVTVRYDADDPEGGTADGRLRVYYGYPVLAVCLVGLAALFGFAGRREFAKLRQPPPPSLFDVEQDGPAAG